MSDSSTASLVLDWSSRWTVIDDLADAVRLVVTSAIARAAHGAVLGGQGAELADLVVQLSADPIVHAGDQERVGSHGRGRGRRGEQRDRPAENPAASGREDPPLAARLELGSGWVATPPGWPLTTS